MSDLFHGEQFVEITSPFIKLDSFLKLAGLCMSGGEAKTLIAEGLIKVNGEVCLQRGRKIKPGDTVQYQGETRTVKADEA